MDELVLVGREEALGDGVVEAVAGATHGGDHVVVREGLLEAETGELAAAVRVEDQAGRRAPAQHCLVEGFEDQIDAPKGVPSGVREATLADFGFRRRWRRARMPWPWRFWMSSGLPTLSSPRSRPFRGLKANDGRTGARLRPSEPRRARSVCHAEGGSDPRFFFGRPRRASRRMIRRRGFSRYSRFRSRRCLVSGGGRSPSSPASSASGLR